uniref:Uncharacterized protein n=1 Tax=Anguilla anguilla TaxID=7936 RepID=A0A0E9SID3_ANGAN
MSPMMSNKRHIAGASLAATAATTTAKTPREVKIIC